MPTNIINLCHATVEDLITLWVCSQPCKVLLACCQLMQGARSLLCPDPMGELVHPWLARHAQGGHLHVSRLKTLGLKPNK